MPINQEHFQQEYTVKQRTESIRISRRHRRASCLRRRWAGVSLAAWCGAMALTAGCGGEATGVAVHPVAGNVLVRGAPASGAKIVFYTTGVQDPRTPIPQATAGDDGAFELTSFKPGDGAPAGDYRVTIEWPAPLPAGVNPEMYGPKDRLSGRYATPEKSGLSATVADGDNLLPPFYLK